MDQQEEWRTVVGFPGYEVSSMGRVRSIARMIPCARNQSLRTLMHGRIRALSLGSNGYLILGLYHEKRAVMARVHRLVCEAFHGLSAPGMQVNHKNGIKTDNRAENLEWVTSSDNLKHAFRVLMRRPSNGSATYKGERHVRSRRFDLELVAQLFAQGMTTKEVAARIGASKDTALLLKRGEHWTQRTEARSA